MAFQRPEKRYLGGLKRHLTGMRRYLRDLKGHLRGPKRYLRDLKRGISESLNGIPEA